ncbi:MAG: Dihydroorotase [Alphaproteobacteria bacterium MarineAlpha9_Bin4]|nr:dihydroorotase [Pelagibacterales bacterium]PPR26687.1 MAG: Dihydroorotase [Alphaproteobacteria bacterium MarineAlpha9_Bin4]|tara:strand:+ start:239 stop:1540 length:1302 start_codon:yes stop_codon:yes gene_type:complete
MTKIIFTNAHIVDPSQNINKIGTVTVENKNIIEISTEKISFKKNEKNKIIDCKKLILSPGFIDLKCHLRVPGDEHKENLSYASKAAASSGITSLICMPNTNPIIDNVSIVELLQRKARKESDVKIYSTASITKKLQGKELSEFGLLSEAGALAFTDAITSVHSSAVMYKALKYASAFDILLMQHPEEKELSDGGSMTSGKLSTELGIKGIPIEAEVIQVERDIRLAEMTNGKIHFLNISTGLALEAIKNAKKKGLKISCSTSPHYFSLNEKDIKKWRTFAKLSPPLRDEENMKLVKEAIADDIISCITSDHSPHDTDSKRLPFEIASAGSIGFESLLPLTLKIVKEKKLGITKLVNLLSTKPAELLKLNSGSLKKGNNADIVIFDPNKKITLSPKNIKSKSNNFPYEKTKGYGEVFLTMVDGKIIFKNGKLNI